MAEEKSKKEESGKKQPAAKRKSAAKPEAPAQKSAARGKKAADSAAAKSAAAADKSQEKAATPVKKAAKKSGAESEKKSADAGGKRVVAVGKKSGDKKETRTARSGPPAFRFEERDNFGFLIFDMPDKSVNLFNEASLRDLDDILDELAEKFHLKALLITSAKPGTFIAGADINEIRGITDPQDGELAAREGQRVFSKLAALRYPTIAVIDGACVGGGLELALACSYRIARESSTTRIGLPEIRLGILPAWGGSQRLPRLIGIQKALDYILTGKVVDARRAYRDGIVDRVIPSDFPQDHTRKAALQFANELLSTSERDRVEKRRQKGGLQTVLLEKNPLGRKILFDQARKKTLQTTKGQYPAPPKALEVVQQGMDLTLEDGLKLEAKALGSLIVTDVSKNLIAVFQRTEELKKDPGVAIDKAKLPAFRRIGVLGAGAMGGGIAQLAAYYDRPVRMKDLNLAAIGAGMQQASKVFNDAVKRRRMKPDEAKKKLGLISGSTDYSGFEHVDLIIEAIIEDMEIKKKVFAEIDGIARPEAILASNTSSLSVSEMAAATKRPEQVAGMHFFNPVHRMPLVEVIRGKKSSDATIASLVQFSRDIGKTPIIVKDSPGFLVNRILSPYMNEATLLLEEGQRIDHIDRAIEKFGMPMGPLTLFDEVGIDVTYKVSGVLEKAFGELAKPSAVIAKMYENKRYGKKSGKGFYIHQGKKKSVSAEVYGIIGQDDTGAQALSAQEIQERCILLMVNEAARCLEEEVVQEPRDVDIGMIFGTGFPPFRGGLLRYADSLGVKVVREKLEHYAEKCGVRFKPASLIVEMAKAGKSFYK